MVGGLFQFLKAKNDLTDAFHAVKGGFKSVAAFSAVVNFLALTPSIYMLQVYDRVLASQNETTLLMITLMVIGLYVISGMLESARTAVLVRISNQLDMRVNQRIYNAAYEVNLKNGSANAGQALRDLTNIRQFLTGNAAVAFFDVPWIPIYLAVCFMLSPWIGMLAVSGALISASLAYFNDTKTQKPLIEANKMAVSSGATADNNLRNAEVIEAMGMLDTLRGRWLKDHMLFLHLQSVASDNAALWTHASKYFRMFLQSAALGLGALLVIEGSMSAGMMIAGSILVGKAMQPIDALIVAWKSFSSTQVAYDRLLELLNAAPRRNYGLELPEPKAKLSMESVTCAPPGGRVATLMNINCNIEPGTVVGVVGPSGAGKSTLARVLAGIWTPQAGKVRLDGAEMSQWDRNRLGQYFGYLPQDIELFGGTVAENIARFEEIDSEAVVEAAKMAGVHEMILRLPKGYDTDLGAGGVGLSGGQRQRVGLARAMYKNPKILILDEPNSNLDDAGEQALLQAIVKQKQMGHVVVLITHRTSVLRVTDALIVLAEGQIKLAGPTPQVLEQLQGGQQQNATPAQQAKPPQVVNTQA